MGIRVTTTKTGLLEDRIKDITDRLEKELSELEISYDHADCIWNAWLDNNSDEPSFTASSFEELVEAIEAELEID